MILTNPKFSQLFKDLELKIIQLMENIGAIPENVVQAMKNQAQMGMGQGPNVPGGMGGMLPGSTPMDILQFQQNMQMQQMMQQQQKKWFLCIFDSYFRKIVEYILNSYYEENRWKKGTNKWKWEDEFI